jgi:hypothetical protein
MPLRDHFHLPLRGLCTWESFHSGWANDIMRQLNKTLPLTYVARPKVKLGVEIEADVGTLQKPEPEAREEGGGVAMAVWAPAEPTLSAAVDFHRLDIFEVQIHREGGWNWLPPLNWSARETRIGNPRDAPLPSNARRTFRLGFL